MAAAAGGRPRGAAAPGSAPAATRLWLTGPIALFALLRIPSFLEPHWYTDEAGYVTTARSLLQGRVLYTPGLEQQAAHPPLDGGGGHPALREPARPPSTPSPSSTGLVTLLAVAYRVDRLLGRRRTVVALLVAAVMLGTPLVDAELILPESFLIAPWRGRGDPAHPGHRPDPAAGHCGRWGGGIGGARHRLHRRHWRRPVPSP